MPHKGNSAESDDNNSTESANQNDSERNNQHHLAGFEEIVAEANDRAYRSGVAIRSGNPQHAGLSEIVAMLSQHEKQV